MPLGVRGYCTAPPRASRTILAPLRELLVRGCAPGLRPVSVGSRGWLPAPAQAAAVETRFDSLGSQQAGHLEACGRKFAQRYHAIIRRTHARLRPYHVAKIPFVSAV